MKPLLFIAFTLFSFAAFSQMDKYIKPGTKPQFPLYYYSRPNAQLPFGDSVVYLFQNLSKQRLAAEIVFLPQDGMPCFVPAPPVLGIIPNARAGNAFTLGLMPNATEPFKIEELLRIK